MPGDPFARLPTERPHPRSADLDRLPLPSLLRRLHDIQADVPGPVRRALPAIGRLVELGRRALARGGRILFVGAGTSGRLGAMEAAECPPTFGTTPRQVQAIMAGGARALRRSIEGAEDDRVAGARAMRARRVGGRDLVVGLSASGVTPFVAAAIAAANARMASTALLTCNPAARLPSAPEVTVVLRTGAEALAGSTRLKAGTATKMALNLFTTAVAVRLGKVFQNRMVDVGRTSLKLRARARRMVEELGGVPGPRAEALLESSGGSVKLAVLCARLRVSPPEGRRRLAAAGGHLQAALDGTIRPRGGRP